MTNEQFQNIKDRLETLETLVRISIVSQSAIMEMIIRNSSLSNEQKESLVAASKRIATEVQKPMAK